MKTINIYTTKGDILTFTNVENVSTMTGGYIHFTYMDGDIEVVAEFNGIMGHTIFNQDSKK